MLGAVPCCGGSGAAAGTCSFGAVIGVVGLGGDSEIPSGCEASNGTDRADFVSAIMRLTRARDKPVTAIKKSANAVSQNSKLLIA